MAEPNPIATNPLPQGISTSGKWILWALPWSAVVLICAIGGEGNPGACLIFTALFPWGIFTFLPQELQSQIGMGAPLFVSWLFYLWLTLFCVTSKKTSRFFLGYCILIILLGLSFVGWRIVLKSPKFGARPETNPVKEVMAFAAGVCL